MFSSELTLKLGVGSSETTIKSSELEDEFPALLVTVKLTSKSPELLKITIGFCSVETAGVPPSKVQSQEVAPVDWSRKLTVIGAHPFTTSASNPA